MAVEQGTEYKKGPKFRKDKIPERIKGETKPCQNPATAQVIPTETYDDGARSSSFLTLVPSAVPRTTSPYVRDAETKHAAATRHLYLYPYNRRVNVYCRYFPQFLKIEVYERK